MPAEPQLPSDELRAVFGARPGVVRAEPIYEPVASASIGIWRVRAGPESAVLKLIAHSGGGHENWRSGESPAHWYYWRREVDAYESGLLASLPGGLRAPRCHLVAERADGAVALWLDDLDGVPGGQWELERYETAARHLGQTQGAYIAGRALPDEPWLSRGWMRDYLAQRDGDLDLVAHRDAWVQPFVAAWFPEPPIARVQAMQADQPLYLDALARMPRTVCHLDLHPANLFDGGDDATVAIDWSFVGVGALGEDAGNLVVDAVLDFHFDAERIDDLYDAVAHCYHAGLRDAGWDGNDRAVRLGMSAAIGAKYAWIAPAILRAALEGRELLNRRPIEETLRWWGPAVPFLLARADEARDLART